MTTKKCLAATELNENYMVSEEKNSEGILVSYKLFEWGRRDSGDCEWTYNRAYIYSDGRVREEFRIHDSGTIFGDNFSWSITLKFSDGTIITEWSQLYGLGAGETLEDSIKGFLQEVKDNFDSIQLATRTTLCSQPDKFAKEVYSSPKSFIKPKKAQSLAQQRFG